MEKFDHLFGVGAFEVDEFGHDLRRRHIDHGLQGNELLDDGDVFRDEHSLHIGYGGEGGVGLGRTNKSLEKLGGLLRREVAELHEIADHLIGGRQHVGCGKDRDALGARKFRGTENFHRLVVDRDKRIPVEQERGLDQADGLAAWNLSGHDNGERLSLREHGVPHKALIGQHLVKTEDLVDRSIGESQPHSRLGLGGARRGGGRSRRGRQPRIDYGGRQRRRLLRFENRGRGRRLGRRRGGARRNNGRRRCGILRAGRSQGQKSRDQPSRRENRRTEAGHRWN